MISPRLSIFLAISALAVATAKSAKGSLNTDVSGKEPAAPVKVAPKTRPDDATAWKRATFQQRYAVCIRGLSERVPETIEEYNHCIKYGTPIIKRDSKGKELPTPTTGDDAPAVKAMKKIRDRYGKGKESEDVNDLITQNSACGVPDRSTHRNKRSYSLPHWNKQSMTWKIHQYPATISDEHAILEDVIQAAFQTWADEIGFTITKDQSVSHADFNLHFTYPTNIVPLFGHCPWDGPGGVLAMARYPEYGLIGFDDSEPWNWDQTKSSCLPGICADVFQVAVHEIGHAMGLGHANMPSIMYDGYVYRSTFALPPVDSQSIQTLYETMSQADFCANPKIDAFVEDFNGQTYIFRGRYYYPIDGNGNVGAGRFVCEDFYHMWYDEEVKAAVMVPNGNTMLVFYAYPYFRYTGQEGHKFISTGIRMSTKPCVHILTQEGCVRDCATVIQHHGLCFEQLLTSPDAALFDSNTGHVVFITGDRYHLFVPPSNMHPPNTLGNPLSDIGIPTHSPVNAAGTWNNKQYIFFENGEFAGWGNEAPNTLDSGYPKLMTQHFFNCLK